MGKVDPSILAEDAIKMSEEMMRGNKLQSFKLDLSFLGWSLLQYATSWCIETISGLRYWDYTGVFLNVNGRICFECSVFFGLGGSRCVYIVAPLLERKLQKITTKIKILVCTLLVNLIMMDNIYSIKNPNVGEGIAVVVNK